MSDTNLGRVQGKGYYYSSSSSTTSIPKSTIAGTELMPLTGDTIVNSNYDLLRVTAVGSTAYTVTKYGNIKGANGSNGSPGKDGTNGVTPSITVTATVDSGTGTPSVEVTKSGTDASPSFKLAFSNLKGADGSSATGPILYKHEIVLTITSMASASLLNSTLNKAYATVYNNSASKITSSTQLSGVHFTPVAIKLTTGEIGETDVLTASQWQATTDAGVLKSGAVTATIADTVTQIGG